MQLSVADNALIVHRKMPLAVKLTEDAEKESFRNNKSL